MCWSVYLASNHPLKLIEWNPKKPGFSATSPEPRDEPIRQQFEGKHMVVLSAYDQCGCGFMDEDDGPTDPRRETINQLVTYLNQALADSPELEMFVCWEGGERDEPTHRLVLKPSDFEAPTFPLGDDVHGESGYARIAL